jgi:Polyketide cyclase / dehydrase and lipid transport
VTVTVTGARRLSPPSGIVSAMTPESRHISAHIERPIDEVYDFAADPTNLPRWAPGLCTSVEQVDGRWIAETGMGQVVLTFAPPNAFGVLDHDVTLPSGETIHNPMRVIAHGSGCEVVFSLRRKPGMSDDDFDRDAGAVLADLTRLGQVLEGA